MTDRRDDLRFDRRLLQRPGWIGRDELEAYLASLPDVSEKAVREDLPLPPAGGAKAPGASHPSEGS